MVNINLGAPYAEIIQWAIRNGYATSQAEVVRQALLEYEEQMGELDELRHVHKAVQREMEKIKEGKVKTRSLKEVIGELEGA